MSIVIYKRGNCDKPFRDGGPVPGSKSVAQIEKEMWCPREQPRPPHVIIQRDRNPDGSVHVE